MGVGLSNFFVDLKQRIDPGHGGVHARRERQTDRYGGRLKSAVKKWGKRYRNRRLEDPDRRRVALENLRITLSRLGRKYLPRAFRTGAGIRRLRPDDVIILSTELVRNEDFLMSSFIPYMERELDKGEEEEMTVGGMVRNRGFAWETRIGLYAGVYWTTIYRGLGSRVQPLGVQPTGVRPSGVRPSRIQPSGVKPTGVRPTGVTPIGVQPTVVRPTGVQPTGVKPRGVRPGNIPILRMLNHLATHCNTCPGKAGVYPSWNDMLAFTGGLPGDGSDQCHSNCRCQIEVLIDGAWTAEL